MRPNTFETSPNSLSVGLLESMKRRIDLLLVERGLAESRHKAQAMLLAGQILVKEQKVEKPGQMVDADAEIRILGQLRYASRAGAKLQAALDHFHISVSGRTCADLGASTGGFTDCLLQNGACRVYAFDVGKGQLAWKLRSDPRVLVRDECNVRYLNPTDLPDDLTVVSMDLSFISVTKVLPSLKKSLVFEADAAEEEIQARTVDIIVLVKPQFEASAEPRWSSLATGGRRRILESIEAFALRSGYKVRGSIPSPVSGMSGNQEFLLWLQLQAGPLSVP